jgi:O-antigen ligase
MKLKTLKELGVNDVDITTYERVKEFKLKRNRKGLLYSFYDLPMLYLIVFASPVISTFINIYLFFSINKQLSIITSLTFDNAKILIVYLFIINLIAVCIFLICMLCISTYSHGLKQKEKIEKEYLKED